MADKKFTKIDMFNTIINVLNEIEIAADENTPSTDEVINWCKGQIEVVEKKASKARETAAKKKAENDVYKERVYDFIANSEEPVTADDIVADIGEESFTKAKAVARCTALVKEGRITKEEIKVNKVRKMTYQVAETEEEEA